MNNFLGARFVSGWQGKIIGSNFTQTEMKLCGAVLIALLVGLSGCKPPGGAKAIPLDSLDAPEESKTLLKGHAAKAARFGRNALVHFSLVGCGPCIRLDEEVFFKREWRDWAKENLIETVVEFPNEITSEDTVLVQNMQAMEALAKRLNLSPGFPQLVILGRDGSVLGGRSGYQPGGAAGYISWAKALLEADTSPRTTTSAAAQTTQVTNPPAVSPVVHKSALPEQIQTATTSPVASAPAPQATLAPALADSQPSQAVARSNAVDAKKPAATPCDYFRITGSLGSGSNRILILTVGSESYNLRVNKEVVVQTPAGKLHVRCLEIGSDYVLLLVVDRKGEHTCRLPF